MLRTTGPELHPVRVGRQIGGQQPYYSEDYEDPAVRTVLTLPGAQVSATEKRCPRHHEDCDRKSNSSRVGEEGAKTAPAEDCEAEKGKGPDNAEGR